MDTFPQVTRPRIVVPRRRSELLTRQRLLNGLMDRLDNRLVIISAPAGYGKTSLLVDFVHHLEWPACWYAIDELDHDLSRFIAHFISSIQVRFPQFGQATLGILSSSTQDRIKRGYAGGGGGQRHLSTIFPSISWWCWMITT